MCFPIFNFFYLEDNFLSDSGYLCLSITRSMACGLKVCKTIIYLNYEVEVVLVFIACSHVYSQHMIIDEKLLNGRHIYFDKTII